MKIKRFVAADMRNAMRQVREEQGPDAVILSTRRVDDGIEIIAALDYDEALVREAAGRTAELPAPIAELALPERLQASSNPAVQRAAAKTAAARPTTPAAPAVHANAPQHRSSAAIAASVADVVRAATSTPANDAAVTGMRAELNSLREMLEVQLSSLAWNQMDREHPLRARVLREMTRLGIDADVARALTAELPVAMTADQARYLPLGVLSRNIRTSGRDLEHMRGGVTALVGATGVGKTTTIAKLAARAVLRHGAGSTASAPAPSSNTMVACSACAYTARMTRPACAMCCSSCVAVIPCWSIPRAWPVATRAFNSNSKPCAPRPRCGSAWYWLPTRSRKPSITPCVPTCRWRRRRRS